MTRPLVMVAISGGVDSAVAAHLLLGQGYAVAGLHMTNWEEDERYCTAAEDLQDARQICSALGITLHRVNFAQSYRERVFEYFLNEYRAGRTPNPDVVCNREIKFGAFKDHARRLGAQFIATGHYARLRHKDQQVQLFKGRDPHKDQSYFLHGVTGSQLEQTIFPLGELAKDRVRELARDIGLAVHDKRDSTGICFIGERPYRAFLAQYLPAQPGDMVTPEGDVVGRHDGLMYYTLGQRQGLGLGGRVGGPEAPWYVAVKDLQRNQLLVVQGHNHPLLYSNGLVSGTPHWINDPPPSLAAGELVCTAKTRYRQPDQPCRVRLRHNGLMVHFHDPQWAVTPGQYLVLYDGEHCLGGAPIQQAWTSQTTESLAQAG